MERSSHHHHAASGSRYPTQMLIVLIGLVTGACSAPPAATIDLGRGAPPGSTVLVVGCDPAAANRSFAGHVALLEELAAREGWVLYISRPPHVLPTTVLAKFAAIVLWRSSCVTSAGLSETALAGYLRDGGGLIVVGASAPSDLVAEKLPSAAAATRGRILTINPVPTLVPQRRELQRLLSAGLYYVRRRTDG